MKKEKKALTIRLDQVEYEQLQELQKPLLVDNITDVIRQCIRIQIKEKLN